MRKTLLFCAGLLLLAGCAAGKSRNQTLDAIRQEMSQATQASAQPVKPDAVNEALLPPLNFSMPKIDNKPLETKFDLAVNNTPVTQVLMAIVAGTRYSLLLHPDVAGNISLNLKDVTVIEAFEAVREMYGYDYKIDGARIFVQPLTLQTRIFQVNYLTGSRDGASTVAVKSPEPAAAGAAGAAAGAAANTVAGKSSSVITQTSSKDFWNELGASITAIIGDDKGRVVKLNSMSGVIVVRAMPDELKNVVSYLKASQISIQRQVIIEAKIIDVQLNDSFQSGVNWAAFRSPALGNVANSTLAAGQVVPGTILPQAFAGVGAAAGTTAALGIAGAPGSLFGMAFQTNNFAVLLNFLESQGNVHVLSSPRIATLNNQKAVLKVGTDEYFATGFTATPGTATGVVVTQTTITPTYQMFFSGIALDVTPRIDENNEIILHVHPSVSKVGTVDKQAIIGVAGVAGTIPLASSIISETDSVVRAHDGQIVAIGGLMRQDSINGESGLPGLPKSVFGQTSKVNTKRELVILIKPTVVDNDRDWSDDIAHSRDRVESLTKQIKTQ